MEIKFTNKKTVSGMGFYFMQVHFASGSSSISEANSESIPYLVKTGHTVTQLLISWLDIIQIKHFHLELFKKLSIFSYQNQIIRYLQKFVAKAALEVGYLIHL